jgi:hypothetical protein
MADISLSQVHFLSFWFQYADLECASLDVPVLANFSQY